MSFLCAASSDEFLAPCLGAIDPVGVFVLNSALETHLTDSRAWLFSCASGCSDPLSSVFPLFHCLDPHLQGTEIHALSRAEPPLRPGIASNGFHCRKPRNRAEKVAEHRLLRSRVHLVSNERHIKDYQGHWHHIVLSKEEHPFCFLESAMWIKNNSKAFSWPASIELMSMPETLVGLKATDG